MDPGDFSLKDISYIYIDQPDIEFFSEMLQRLAGFRLSNGQLSHDDFNNLGVYKFQ